MARVWILVIAGVLLPSCRSGLLAGPGDSLPPEKVPPALRVDASGILKSVDPSASRLVLTVGLKVAVDRTYAVNADTVITLNGKGAALADLRPGMHAQLTLSGDDSPTPLATHVAAQAVLIKDPGTSPK